MNAASLRVFGATATIVAGAVIVARIRLAFNKRRVISVFYHLHPSDVDEIPHLKTAMAQSDIHLAWSESIADAPDNIDVLIKRIPTSDDLDRWPTLTHVLTPFAGPIPATQQLVRERPKLTLHTAHFNAVSTAELCVTLLLAVAKGLVPRDSAFRSLSERNDKMWTPAFMEPVTEPPTPTLAGKHVLVLGYGACGTRVARTLNVLGMRVSACRRRAATSPAFDGTATVYGIGALSQLLPTASVVIVCLPGTRSTAGLLGATEVALLPKGALLVNVGRGSVVDERALYDALSSGHLGGAGLDVWYNYPMLQASGLGDEPAQNLGPASRDCPFWSLPNVVMSAHRGQASDTKAPDRVKELARMLEELAATGTMPNAFDLEQGY